MRTKLFKRISTSPPAESAAALGWAPSAVLMTAVLLCAGICQAQESPASPAAPQPISINQIGAAIAGTSGVQSIELTGQVTRFSSTSQPETDPIWLEVDSDGTTRMKITSPGGGISEVRSAPGTMRPCTSSADTAASSTGTVTPAIAYSNCWNSASWVFPTLAFGNTTTMAAISAGSSSTMKDGAQVLQIALKNAATGHSDSIRRYVQSVSARTVYLDPRTLLPVSMTYSEHPGNKTYISMPVEISYGGYRTTDGVAVPYHITKTVNGQKMLDITVEQVVVHR